MNEEINIFKALDFIRDNADKFAQAKANRVHIEEYRKSLKAKMMIAAELKGTDSAAKQERDAYSSKEYIDLLEGLKVAVEEEERLRWMLEAARLKVSVWQSIGANQRFEAKSV